MEVKENNTHISALLSKLSGLWAGHKIPICITAAVAALCVTVSAGTVLALRKKPESPPKSDSLISDSESAESVFESDAEIEETAVSSAQESVASVNSESSNPVSSAPKK